ncbi:MAG: PAS domain-containing protein [Paraperlucidibaca sp.]|jgi:PAS domain S-box-containing protein|nr:PAS domain-containing protein [Paraperlucidibaca sp.]MBQ0723548.1 PAS domain-containing protein [Paraperlucidibaca sp.]MBQ0842379.1 PAS domain-containing protein [Paraperlucidibaca sp.]
MIFSPTLLFTLTTAYLGLLFFAAYASEHGWIPLRWVRHPAVFVLSLGVFVSTWGLFGAVQFARESGFNFLTFYIGLAGAFLLAPVFLQPLFRLARSHQLTSLPDLLAFRYRSQAAGTLATIAMLIGVMPLLTTQMQTVGEVARILTGGTNTKLMGLVFCVMLIGFTSLFGAGAKSSRHQENDGLVVAIALESVIKLIAISAVGLYAYFGVLGGSAGVNDWLSHHPEALRNLFQPLKAGYWHSLLLVFFFASVVMPCLYHMAFTENREPRNLLTATWAFPLYLLVMALGIPIILWAGQAIGLADLPEFYSLGVAIESRSPALVLLLFIGALASSSGILIVTTLALANMTLNHVILPLRGWPTDDALYLETQRQRRFLIGFILLAAFMLSWLPGLRPDSTEMSMLSFVAILQLAPSVLALLFWPRATRSGMLTGLSFGMAIWIVMLAIPSLFLANFDSGKLLGIITTSRLDHWQAMGIIATLGNGIVLVVVSLLQPQSAADREVAEACSVDNLSSPVRWSLAADSVDAFVKALTPALGPLTAEREVGMARNDLNMASTERRPYALRRLRDQLGANLSGLLGPSLAMELLDKHLPQQIVPQSPGEDIHFIESRLEEYRDKLSGLAAELDTLRRFHRQTLHDLPLGVCTLAGDLEVLSWNRAIMDITGCADIEVIGSRLSSLPEPWNHTLTQFLNQPGALESRHRLNVDGQTRWINLHRAMIGDADGSVVLVMEEITALQQLESRLHHSERLAAVGRLAAGVAHEIGNPITGIACLAQNLKAEHAIDHEVHATAQDILDQTKRVTSIVQSLVGFARTEHHVGGEFDNVPLLAVVNESLHLLKLAPEARQVDFRVHIDSSLGVYGDAQRLCQVFINLLGNARDASTQSGRILVRARQHGPSLRIEIEDFGHGLPDGDLRERLFEPFVTTKALGDGTGLGLALVHGIIEAHDGRIQLIDKRDYDQGTGVIVQITLPAAKRNEDMNA